MRKETLFRQFVVGKDIHSKVKKISLETGIKINVLVEKLLIIGLEKYANNRETKV